MSIIEWPKQQDDKKNLQIFYESRKLLTLVFRSTHSSQDKVGLFRFCFFLGGSSVFVPFRWLLGVGVPANGLSIAVGETIG